MLVTGEIKVWFNLTLPFLFDSSVKKVLHCSSLITVCPGDHDRVRKLEECHELPRGGRTEAYDQGMEIMAFDGGQEMREATWALTFAVLLGRSYLLSSGGVQRATSCPPSFGSRWSMRCRLNAERLCPDVRYHAIKTEPCFWHFCCKTCSRSLRNVQFCTVRILVGNQHCRHSQVCSYSYYGWAFITSFIMYRDWFLIRIWFIVVMKNVI